MSENSEDSHSLWERLMRDVKIYAPQQTIPHKRSSAPERLHTRHNVTSALHSTTISKSTDNRTTLPPMPARWRQNIKKGNVQPEARIDLHGMSTAAAHSRFSGFFRANHLQGRRLLLVITGKGRDGNGVIRRELRFWLEENDTARYIAGVMSAPIAFGGDGATLILIKRQR